MGLGALVVLGVAYAWFFGAQTICTLSVRYMGRRSPVLFETPAQLRDSSVSSTPHAHASCGGYDFELPWNDVNEKRSRSGPTTCVTAFQSGNAFVFMSSAPRSFADFLANELKVDPSALQRAVVGETSQSDSGLVRTILETTPSDVKPFMSKRRAARDGWLLFIKGIATPSAKSGIFEIHTPDLQGFQLEAAESRPFAITEELFGNDGEVDLTFGQKVGGSAPAITQAEINRIIQSIRKIPTSAAVSTAIAPPSQRK
ncbi:MAG: hypothetical protein ABSA32_09825 [Candidatus Acidiferrales bacterium]